MITHDDVVHAHEQTYRIVRAGLWHRRVGLAAMLLGLSPAYFIIIALLIGGGQRLSELTVSVDSLVFFGLCGALGVGGFVQRTAGTVMHRVSGTRGTDRVRRACAVAALGALCSSAPALLLVGAIVWEVVLGRAPAASFCGLLCAAPLFIPTVLLYESGWLWLRYPAAVETILEGRVALQPEPRPPMVSPPAPEQPPIVVDDDPAIRFRDGGHPDGPPG